MGRKATVLWYISATLLMMTPTPLDMSMARRMGPQPCNTAGLAYLFRQEYTSRGGIIRRNAAMTKQQNKRWNLASVKESYINSAYFKFRFLSDYH